MLNKLINGLLILVFVIGILGAGNLVLNELSNGNSCPRLLSIPACYIIFVCFVIPLIVHLLGKLNYIYFIFTGAAFCIALVASRLQVNGTGNCPTSETGTPLCYYSLLLFSSLLLLKALFIYKKNVSKNL